MALLRTRTVSSLTLMVVIFAILGGVAYGLTGITREVNATVTVQVKSAGVADLRFVVNNWGVAADDRADLTGDGVVDIRDLAQVGRYVGD